MPIDRDALNPQANVNSAAGPAKPLRLLAAGDVAAFLASAPANARAWAETSGFEAKPGRFTLLPGEDGAVGGALLVLGERPSLWDAAAAHAKLPEGAWRLEGNGVDAAEAAHAWLLASYRYGRYKEQTRKAKVLHLPDGVEAKAAVDLADAIGFGRDLVNTPAGDLGPAELAEAVARACKAEGARTNTIVGAGLLEQNFPAVHAVGRAATEERAPRLLDVTWGDEAQPKLTLIGKGVCFDTGGLNLKPGNSMALMKKDMGGAAATAALALAIMRAQLPVRLRLLIPAVENSVSADSFRPGDVVQTRKGLTIEVGNTDAEGRVILADALSLAVEEKPDLIVDCATLTGAARVALGPQLPALFATDDDFAGSLIERGLACHEPLWRMPLHQPYNDYIKSRIADVNNAGSKPLGGAITAALFLQRFAGDGPWAHLDMFGWNDDDRPGRPRGGEAVAVRPMFEAIKARYAGGEA